MRCRDAKEKLAAQRDHDLAPLDAAALQEHLHMCPSCRALQHSAHSVDSLLSATVTPRVHRSISTDSIMLAIQHQSKISQQLEDIHKQQQTRVARLRPAGAAFAALSFFTLSTIPLLVLAITIVQTDLVVQALALLNGVIDALIILMQYLLSALYLLSRNNWLLSGVAFSVVIMMGMWLRLMRHPQEA
ncbi:MAG TPA: zf-HC2 domain-containing protein [Ktedonobacteraceae bacterium]|jgi:predicted anti-sigma-YlaC factor YlaD|nr:zf-HC2 domain-containing protein [Ktedonobacteraceae bacterium]